MTNPFQFGNALPISRHPSEAAIERIPLRADPTRTFAITPAEAWDRAVAEILEWATHVEGEDTS